MTMVPVTARRDGAVMMDDDLGRRDEVRPCYRLAEGIMIPFCQMRHVLMTGGQRPGRRLVAMDCETGLIPLLSLRGREDDYAFQMGRALARPSSLTRRSTKESRWAESEPLLP